MPIVFFQTADAFKYQTMLRATSRTVIEYCRRSGCLYESFTGLKRGIWPWQATFNRIVMFDDLLRRDFRGWAIYLDADAYIVDLNFDLRHYLSGKSDHAAILAPSGASDHVWDVNAGVCLVNMNHDIGRHIVREWSRHFMAIPDAALRDAVTWMEADNDQDLLQRILRDDDAVMQSVYLESFDLINSSYATFIRQHLRQYTEDFALRLHLVNQSVDRILGDADARNVDLNGREQAGDQALNDAIVAIYEGLLEREPDPDGQRRAFAGLQVRGFKDGLRALARDIAASAEFSKLRTPR